MKNDDNDPPPKGGAKKKNSAKGGTKKKEANSQVNPLSNSPGRESRSNRGGPLGSICSDNRNRGSSRQVSSAGPSSSAQLDSADDLRRSEGNRQPKGGTKYGALRDIDRQANSALSLRFHGATGQSNRREMTNETPSLTDEKMTDENTTPTILSAPAQRDPLDNVQPRNASTTNTMMMTMKRTTSRHAAPNAK